MGGVRPVNCSDRSAVSVGVCRFCSPTCYLLLMCLRDSCAWNDVFLLFDLAVSCSDSASAMSIMSYSGGTVVAMAGAECVCIGSDLRFGEQMTTIASNQKKV